PNAPARSSPTGTPRSTSSPARTSPARGRGFRSLVKLGSSPTSVCSMSEDIRFESRMSDADALMWGIEKDPMLRSTITAISLLDRAPDPVLMLDSLERGTRLIPRLRQRVVGTPSSGAPPRWEVDPNFDLSFH